MFNIITQKFSTNIFHELQKHIDNWSLDWEICTLCDLRRKIEDQYGIWIFSNQEILNSISSTWGHFTSRCENETWDICYYEWDEIVVYLEKIVINKKINWIIKI